MNQYETKIKKLPKSEVEMEISIPADFLTAAKKKAVNMFSLSVEVPGFRKGHVPENVVIEKVGEGRILEEAADICLKEHFPKIMVQEKLDIIGQPQISITKMALGNPLELKAKFAVMPEIELPDYKKIAKAVLEKEKGKEEKIEAKDAEIDEVLTQIRRNKAHMDWHKANPESKGHDHPDFGKEENLPALDDELAKQAGNFKNVEDLKEKIKENIIEEKKSREVEKKRALIMEELMKKTKCELPEILIESETEKSLAKLKDDVERGGGKWQDYLEYTKKDDAGLKKDLRESSEKRALIQIIFNKIAEVEKIEPNKEVLENEVKEIQKYYPDASEENARIYVSTILINQEVLKLLEQN